MTTTATLTTLRGARTSLVSRAVLGRLGAACAVLVATLAVARVRSASSPADGRPATDADRHAVFAAISADEPATRTESAHSFPGDAWSQDDDFHEHEQERARKVAAERGVHLGEVLRALDDGLREEWPSPARGKLQPGVPPCRPRLSY
jgi:hypothetical protein